MVGMLCVGLGRRGGREGGRKKGRKKERKKRENLTSRRVFLHKGNPFLSPRIRMVRQLLRPAPLNDIFRPLAFDNNLIRKGTRLAQDQQIQLLAQIPMIDHGILPRIARLQRHASSAFRREELRD